MHTIYLWFDDITEYGKEYIANNTLMFREVGPFTPEDKILKIEFDGTEEDLCNKVCQLVDSGLIKC